VLAGGGDSQEEEINGGYVKDQSNGIQTCKYRQQKSMTKYEEINSRIPKSEEP
jgi:hypothetical protein